MFTPRSRTFFLTSAGAGILCGIFFCISIASDMGGNFLILPPLLLLLIGLALGVEYAAIACLAALLITLLFTGPPGFLFLAWFIALPTYFFITRTLLWRQEGTTRAWYPMLRVLTELTLIIAASLLALSFITRAQGGLHTLLPQEFNAAFKDADPDIAAMIAQLPQLWGFMIFACLGSLWILTLYGLATLSNAFLKLKHLALRPSLALAPQDLPEWQLLMLALAALLATLGKGEDRFAAEAMFALFLLPYLLSGIAFVHTYAKNRPIPLRRLWITCFYVALIFGRWPVLLVVGIGLYSQLAEMLDRRKKIG